MNILFSICEGDKSALCFEVVSEESLARAQDELQHDARGRGLPLHRQRARLTRHLRQTL